MGTESNADRPPRGREETIESLVNAAERLFAQRGVNDVSVREIASEAQVNPGLLHRHFDDKQALVFATFSRAAAEAHALLEGLEDPGEAAAVMFEFVTTKPAFARTLASVLLSSMDPTAVLPPHGPIRRLLAVMEDAGGPEHTTDFLTVIGLGLGWAVFSPALQFLSGTTDEGFAAQAELVKDRVRTIAEGDS